MALFVALLWADGVPATAVFVGSYRVVPPDFALAGALAVAMMYVGLGASFWHPRFREVALIFGVALGSSFLSMMVSGQLVSPAGLKSNLNVVEFFAVFFCMTVLIRDLGRTKLLVNTFLGAAAILAALTTLKAFGFQLPGFERKTVVTLGSLRVGGVALFDGVMAFSLVLLGALPGLLLGRKRSRLLRWIWLAVFLVAALATYSRNLWVAVFLQMMGVFLLGGGLKRHPFLRLALRGIGVSMGVLVALNLRRIFEALVALRSSTVETRLALYRTAMTLVFDQPEVVAFGVGRAGYMERLAQVGHQEVEGVIHNVFLDMLATNGVLFTLAMTYLVVVVVVRLYRLFAVVPEGEDAYAMWLFLGVLGMVSYGMFAPITMSLVFWGYVGIAYAFVLNAEFSASRMKGKNSGRITTRVGSLG